MKSSAFDHVWSHYKELGPKLLRRLVDLELSFLLLIMVHFFYVICSCS